MNSSACGAALATRVEAFVRETVVPYETDPRLGAHGPSEALVAELRGKAREAGLMTPHILPDGGHLSQRETALVLRASGLSMLGPVALNTAAPDEGNMFLLGRIATPEQQQRFLAPLVPAWHKGPDHSRHRSVRRCRCDGGASRHAGASRTRHRRADGCRRGVWGCHRVTADG